MLFNSFDFAVFLPIVYLLYWFVVGKNIRFQNFLIVAASFLFYGWWDWKFLFLLLFSSLVDYSVGMGLLHTNNETKRKALLWTSITVNLGFLGFFKYFNFFADSFVEAFTFFGTPISSAHLNIILPVGISFYTFQTLSYSIDVYKRKLEPTKDIVAFLAFVSFFPQLVAGPIERATHLLPQFYSKRVFNYHLSVDGLRQILWGLFKKMVIADNCAEYANLIFNDSAHHSGSTLLMGAVFFSFQIYGDFSGYSDIAIGTSKLFGFDLMQNFSFPYFSKNMAEFWKRWHISLSTWFRDYLYIPLGGSKNGLYITIRNTLIIFIVSGFWHGANWTFIAWGALNALYFIPLLFNKQSVSTEIAAKGKLLPSAKEFIQILSTYLLTVIAWVFFRANTVSQAVDYIKRIFTPQLLSMPSNLPKTTLVLLCFFIAIEWMGRENKYAIEKMFIHSSRAFRLGFYYLLLICIIMFTGSQQQFIYFQF